VHDPELHVEVYLRNYRFLPDPCQYIFLLMNFIAINQEKIQTNLSVHNINTGNKHHLPRPDANIFCFQKSIFVYKKVRSLLASEFSTATT